MQCGRAIARSSKNIKNKQEAIKEFLLYKHNKKQSPQTINLALNAIKFLHTKVMKDPQNIDLKFAKKIKNYLLYSHEQRSKK